jgi:hypothetical protein
MARAALAIAFALAALANANALGQNIANELSLVPRELLQYSSRALAFARTPIDSGINSVVPRNESLKINLRVNSSCCTAPLASSTSFVPRRNCLGAV